MRILHLTVTREPFQVMVTGEKKLEYRKPSEWILSRLRHPLGYDVVKIVNGYGPDKPYFIAKYLGYTVAGVGYTQTYSNGLNVQVSKGDIRIHLGQILETGPASSPADPSPPVCHQSGG